ncbi:aspartyl protease [Candidatus Poribacteria bacterium]|nr:aspartyl protease [Candidatus Poribacteria bacterium]MYA58405.1 aspartyl protease [Candidatus Poribacteria bacterium]
MEHTTRIELENLKDLHAVELGVRKSEEVRRLTIENALVDTGATGLCLPKSLIEQLGLTPLRSIEVQTANGPAERTVYSEVRYTVLERTYSIQVTDLPEDAPVLVGHMILEALDLCVDMRKGLIHNPAHGGAWTIKML